MKTNAGQDGSGEVNVPKKQKTSLYSKLFVQIPLVSYRKHYCIRNCLFKFLAFFRTFEQHTKLQESKMPPQCSTTIQKLGTQVHFTQHILTTLVLSNSFGILKHALSNKWSPSTSPFIFRFLVLFLFLVPSVSIFIYFSISSSLLLPYVSPYVPLFLCISLSISISFSISHLYLCLCTLACQRCWLLGSMALSQDRGQLMCARYRWTSVCLSATSIWTSACDQMCNGSMQCCHLQRCSSFVASVRRPLRPSGV